MSTGNEWTDETWNPMTGCTEISAGCDKCYAAVVARGRAAKHYRKQLPVIDRKARRDDTFAPRFWPDRLRIPYGWRRPRRIFVNSMSDVFHADFDDDHLDAVLKVIEDNPRHHFQVLTKRPERAARMLDAVRGDRLPENLWLGVTVENVRALKRVEVLRSIPAAVRFLSCEPLLEDISDDLDVSDIDWVIGGGESGHGCRPCHPDWLFELADLCGGYGVPYFLKQLGGFPNPRSHERAIVYGRTYKAFPRPHPAEAA